MMSMASKAADELSDLQRFQDKAVGLVYNRCVQRGQIDARGVFRVMPHRLANGRERDVLAPGDGSPCIDRKSTRLNSSHASKSRMPSSA